MNHNLLLLAGALALAAAHAAPPVKESEMPPMTAAQHEAMHKLPPGTGESDDGAWLVAPVTGTYTFHNGGILNVTTNAVDLQAGRVYRIAARGPTKCPKPTKKTPPCAPRKPLLWTLPGATAPSAVPAASLIPVKAKDVYRGPALPPTPRAP